MNTNHDTTPSIETLQRLAREQFSLGVRLRYVGLACVAAMATTVVASLLLTEPQLPARTQAAFAAMSAIGIAWIAFAIWVLRERRPLLAWHRVVAGRMAVTFCAVFAIGAGIATATTFAPAAFGAFATGVAMVVAAVAMLVRANRRHAQLRERRDVLERALRDGD